MFNFLLIIQSLSVVVLLVEAGFVFAHLNTRMHAYLFIYLVANIINSAGYIMEMIAATSEAAYIATRMLYLGKVFIPVALLLFVLKFCHIRLPQWGAFILVGFHALVWILIFTNDAHHLFYTSIEYVNEGLFPHNVYGHGPLYYFYQIIPVVYAIISIVLSGVGMRKMPTKIERRQLRLLIESPMLAMIGFVVFLTGITQGYDTSNLGFFFAAIFMLVALFRYDLIDTADMVKNNVIDNLDDGVIATDFLGRLAYVNNKARSLFTNLDEKHIGEGSGLLMDLKNRAEHKEQISIGDEVFNVVNKELKTKDIFRGNLYVLDNMTEVAKYTKRVEEEREIAIEANAAKSRFLSNMSHEIRTPMNAIVGMTDIMLRDDLPQKEIEYLNNIRSSSNALLEIINDILDFSKIESGKMEVVNDEYEPLTMLNELKMIFLTRIGDKPIRLGIDIDGSLPAKLYGDRVRIRQTIINLMNNAIKYTDVGYVRLGVGVEPLDETTINLHISVKDSGLGIKEEDMDSLFGSFSQVDARKNHAKEGTGLGLTITKQLVELMGGTIGVKSDYGSGSEFYFSIPQKVVDKTLATEYKYEKKEKEDIDFTAPEAKILLVEDNVINVKVAQGLLAPTQVQIDVAENGLVALRMISEKQYDLVFMDHMMPVMDGVEATEKIRGFKGDYFVKVPIIALTANAVSGAQEEFTSAGMNDFISKPIDINQMKQKMRKWLPEELIKPAEQKDNNSGKTDNEISKEESKENREDKEGKEENMQPNEEYGELDRNLGIQYCGTEELYEEILTDFYKLIDTKVEKINELLSQDDIHDYTIEVHALKSTARMIGATRLSELSYEMEMAGKENNRELIDQKTPTLIKMYEAYKDTLAYLDTGDGDKEEVSNEVIRKLLEDMLKAADEFDMDTVDANMSELNKYNMPTDKLQSDFNKLDILVRDVAFEEIKQLLPEMISLLN